MNLTNRAHASPNSRPQRFEQVLAETRAAGFTPRYIHIANSAGALLLGTSPAATWSGRASPSTAPCPPRTSRGRLDLQPVMRLKSRIAMLKWVEPAPPSAMPGASPARDRTLIASVPVGYADGYPRALTNKAEVLVRGQRARVTGTVCMDWIMLDVTDIPGSQRSATT